MKFSCFFRVALLALLLTSGSTLLSREDTYSPKTEDELQALSEIVAIETGINNLKYDDFICLSVDGLRPSPQFVESFRQRNLRVCSFGERSQRPNSNIELRLENVRSETPMNVTVRSKVFALGADNKSKSNLVLIEDGEYVMEKVRNGEWSIKKYLNHWQPSTAVPGGGWFADDCNGASFSIDKIEGAPGERVLLRLKTGQGLRWTYALGKGWIGWDTALKGVHCSSKGACTDATHARLLLDNASEDANRLSGQYTLDVGDQHFEGAFTLDYRSQGGVFVCE